MPGTQGPKTAKGAQSDPNYVSRLLACSECLPGATKIIVTPLVSSYQTTRGITSNFSSRAFSVSVSAPSTWNSLPAHIRSIDTLSTFKRHLKFHLFQSAFTV